MLLVFGETEGGVSMMVMTAVANRKGRKKYRIKISKSFIGTHV